MDTERERAVDKLVLRVKDLSTLPAVMEKIMELTSDPDVSIAELEEAISTDPVISTKLLRIVNSAYYSFFREITSIRHAIVVLGLQATKNLVYGTSIITAFGGETKIERFPLLGFWEFSVACGNLSRTLSSLLDYPFYEEAFLAGLVHDIGKLIMANLSTKQFEEALVKAQEDSIPLSQAEDEVVGFNHSDLGLRLAERWRLPQLLREAIAFNEQPRQAEGYPELTSVVRLASQFCRLHSIGVSGEPEIPIELRGEEAWQVLSESNGMLETLDFERFTLTLDEEIEKVRSFVHAIFGE